MKVKFVESNNYYFEVENNTIYGREKYSSLYFHELSHYIDHLNPLYRKTSMFFSFYGQNLAFWFISIMFLFFVSSRLYFITFFLTCYSIYSSFIFTEELRAMYNSYIWVKKWKNKTLKLNKNGLIEMTKR